MAAATAPPPEKLEILRSASLEWHRARQKDGTGWNYYARYRIPGTTQYALFEATPAQFREIYGDNLPDTTRINVDEVIRRPGWHFAGGIGEVAGKGLFEHEVRRVISLALDQGDFPDWIKNDPAAMGLLWLKVSEKKTNDWFYESIQTTAGFKKRYPGLNKLTGMGLSVGESVKAFTQYETNLKKLHAAAGFHPDAVTPGIVGNLLGRGYDLSYVQNSYATWKRMKDNAPALQAFNQVLASQGKPALKGTDMYKFLQGQAPQAIYDVYEASSIREAANATGFKNIFSAQDSLTLALSTAENMSSSQAFQQFASIAQQALRFRHELDVAKFGLDVDDLIDVSFGRKPRSGKNIAEVGEALSRAQRTAEAQFGTRANPFTGFNADGTPQQQSFSRSRQGY